MSQQGDKCKICGLPVVWKPCFCKDGKPNKNWARHTDVCPCCLGEKGHWGCPIITSISDDFRGRTCKDYEIYFDEKGVEYQRLKGA